MDKFNATHLTFGMGKMKSLLRLCVFLFFPPLWVGGYCCLSFGGRRAPEKTLWLASLPRDATAVPSAPNRTFISKLHLNPATPHSAEFHISSCTACECRGKNKRRQTDIEMTHACICVHVGSILRWNAALFLLQSAPKCVRDGSTGSTGFLKKFETEAEVSVCASWLLS